MRTNLTLPFFFVAFAVGCADRLQVDSSTNGVSENDHVQSDDDADESEATSEGDDIAVDSGAVAPSADDDSAEPALAEIDDDSAISEPETSEPEVSEPEVSEPEASEPVEPTAPPPEPAPSVDDDTEVDLPEPETPEPVPSADAGMSESTDVLECPFNETLTYDPGAAYPFCQWGPLPGPMVIQPGQPMPPSEPLGWEKYCPQYEYSWGFFNWHAEGENAELCENDDTCNACNCSIQCDQDTPSGCPAGETGNAVPTCFNSQPGITASGDCWLTCNEGEQCPDGMQCVLNPEYGSMVCAWITEGDRCSDEQLYSSP